MDDTTYLIYKHTSPSGKSYIGQTNNYDRRCKEHQKPTACRLFRRAVKKYGWDNFKHEILMEGLSLDESNHWEPTLISEHNTLTPNGYNLMTGGLNSTHSEETKAKMSATKLGHIHSDESKAKMSKAQVGKVLSEATKAKMSKAKQHMSAETKAKLSEAKQGTTHSEETKAKMSATKLGHIHSDESKAKMSKAKKGKKRG